MVGTLFTYKKESPETLKNRGNAAMQGGNLDRAESLYRQAIAADSSYMPAHYNLGNLLRQTGRHDEALTAYEAAAQLAPDDFEIRVNAGVTLTEMSRLDEAIASFAHAARLAPSALEPILNMGVALDRSRRYGEAVTAWNEVLRRDPGASIARHYRGMAYLRLGRWQEGFADFESRLDLPGALPDNLPDGTPKWNGSPLDGKTLMIYPESGVGDMIQFLRYVPLCKAAGARVMVCCQPPLARLLATVTDIDVAFPDGLPLPEAFDAYTSVMSLPHVCGHHPELPPLRINVPVVPLAAIASARGLKVGIFWREDIDQNSDRERSIRTNDLARGLEGLAGVSFFSLQTDATSAAFATSLASHIQDFADTAGLVQQLDLVISIDTGVAHLCASLGVPTWLLASYSPDWRWGIAEDTTPWYPSVHIFRQAAPGDWSVPLKDIRDRLIARSA